MKSYQVVKQERDNYCIPAVLQAILRRHGEKVSQDEIASNLAFGEKGFFSFCEEINRFFRKRGLKYSSFNYNEIPRDMIEVFLDEIPKKKDVFIILNNHAELIIELEYPRIRTIDSYNLMERERDIHEVFRDMYEKQIGEFGLVKKLN